MLKLQAVELSKSYRGRKVVDDLDLEISQGEVVGLLGPNGAGKTTTFYILVGLARPDSGRVLLNGDDITDLPMYLRARSGISYLPRTFGFPAAYGRREPDCGPGNAASDLGTAARPSRGAIGADEAGNGSNQRGLHAFGRRATAAGDRAVAGA